MPEIQIRNLQINEMPFLINLAETEGYNPGLNDAEYYYKADPNGYYVAFVDEKPIGCIAALNYGNGYGFIGFHLIISEFRNNGIGKSIFEFALQKLGDSCIGLNCSESQIDYYKKLGFNYFHKVSTYEGVTVEQELCMDDIITPFMYPFDKVLEFDRKIFPAERKSFLQSWFIQPKSLFLGLMRNKEYKGYGLFIPCSNSYKISNLFCEDENTAEHLLTTLTGHMAIGRRFYINVPESNTAAANLAEKLNLKKVKETVRMYNKSETGIDLNKIYGFTSLEIG